MLQHRVQNSKPLLPVRTFIASENLHCQGNFLSCHGRRLRQICLYGTIPTICSSLSTFQDTEIAKLSSENTTAIVKHMKSIFARHGIPQEIISDNGPQQNLHSLLRRVWIRTKYYTLFAFTWALVFLYFCCVNLVTTNYISLWSPSNTRIVKAKSASIQLQTRDIWPPKNFPIHFLWWVMLVLTNYAQLLLYISYEQSDLYMLVTTSLYL